MITIKASMEQEQEVHVMLGNRRREWTSKLFLLDVLPYRARLGPSEPEPVLVTTYGVEKAAPVAAATPELPLLRWRFDTRA